jgi:hypothetical protein
MQVNFTFEVRLTVVEQNFLAAELQPLIPTYSSGDEAQIELFSLLFH